MKDILKTVPPELIGLFAFTLSFFALLLVINQVQHYDREEYLQSEYERLGGCAFFYCPLRLQERTLAEMGGVYPPSYYERGTKPWIRSFCTYSPQECK